ncbi:MAG TPA: GNAT family N-acetyltransferase [Acidimicrobiales bacterium]|nr:GNAT family N-acetyltransferase [Acidimicrobiales bacterium]
MTTVAPIAAEDVGDVADRVVAALRADSTRQPLVSGGVDRAEVVGALASVAAHTWVARRDGAVAGHLSGARLDAPEYGSGAWVSPDGVSFDDADVLADLYAAAGAAWIAEGALEHYVWALDDASRTAPWFELGFARMHQRGVRRLTGGTPLDAPAGVRIRVGGPSDLDAAVALSAALDRAQALGPSFSRVAPGDDRADLAEALEDPEVTHYLAERDGVPVAQCLTFPLPDRRGSHPHTVHLSAVSVADGERGAGLGTALVELVLGRAAAAGFAFAETNWRVTNRGAARFWVARGFAPTYVRLHRTIGAG